MRMVFKKIAQRMRIGKTFIRWQARAIIDIYLGFQIEVVESLSSHGYSWYNVFILLT